MRHLNLILLCIHLTRAGVYDDGEDYLSLIKWTHDYYSTSAVFLLLPCKSDKHFDTLKLTHLSYVWSRLLGREQVATLSSTFKNIQVLTNNYNALRPLIIVVIPTPDAAYEFSNGTRSLKMSTFAWFVIFLPTTMNKERDHCYNPPGNLFHLLFDTEMLVMCYRDPVLREWYSVDGDTTETYDLIKWLPEKQLSDSSAAPVDILTNLSLYERRNDLRGKVLRAVTVKNSILVTVKGKELKGYFSRAVSELENTLNFTLDIVDEEIEYGSFNMTTKRWTGAFNLVASGEVDIGVADFSMTNIRLDYVDYTVPIITTRNYLYVKEPEIFAVKWFAYYKAFSFALWMSIIVTVIIAQSILAYIRSRIQSCCITKVLLDEFIRIWGIMCQQGVTEFPRNSPLRLAYFTMLVTGIVISSAYSASLICFVTARIRSLPFRTIDEFIKDGGYGVIVVRGSADYDMFFVSLSNNRDRWHVCAFAYHSKDSLSLNIMKSLRPYHTLPRDVQSGFESICRDQRLAFYTGYTPEMQKRAISLHIPCKITYLDLGRVDSLSLILSKKNQYTSVINYYLQKLLNTGLLNRFKNEVNFVEETRFVPVGFGSVASVLIIFSCGAALAFVVLIAEMCCVRCINLRRERLSYD